MSLKLTTSHFIDSHFIEKVFSVTVVYNITLIWEWILEMCDPLHVRDIPNTIGSFYNHQFCFFFPKNPQPLLRIFSPINLTIWSHMHAKELMLGFDLSALTIGVLWRCMEGCGFWFFRLYNWCDLDFVVWFMWFLSFCGLILSLICIWRQWLSRWVAS